MCSATSWQQSCFVASCGELPHWAVHLQTKDRYSSPQPPIPALGWSNGGSRTLPSRDLTFRCLNRILSSINHRKIRSTRIRDWFAFGQPRVFGTRDVEKSSCRHFGCGSTIFSTIKGTPRIISTHCKRNFTVRFWPL